MKRTQTWRGFVVSVAAVLALVATPSFAGADESTTQPGDAVWEEAITGTSTPTPSIAPFAATTPQATASTPTPDAVWDLFRVVNTRRINQGGAPWVMTPGLNAVSNSWLSTFSSYPSNDSNFISKVPGSFTVGYHTTAWAIATSAAEAVKTLTSSVNGSDMSWGNSTDIGIGMTERPWSGSYKLYSFSLVAVDYSHSSAQAGEMTLYRFYRPSSGTHFYSTAVSERNTVAKNPEYRYEGQVAYVLKPNVTASGTSNLNRFYQPSSGTHFYTSSTPEYNRVRTFPQYSLDGVAGRVYTTQTAGVTPMYRFYRPASATHFYTANESEVASVKQMPGYTFEGIAFYLRKAS